MAFNQYAKTERDFTTLLNSANMTPADRDKLSAVLASLVGFQATQPGTNQTLEEQITGIESEIGEIVAAINNIKVPVWKMQVFDSSGTFTVPDSIAGNVVYVTGSGGGGGGAAVVWTAANNGIGGACSGCYIEKQPYQVHAGESIPVTVGVGGASVTTGFSYGVVFNGGDGGDSSFGSLVIRGGDGGRQFNAITSKRGGWIGGYQPSSTGIVPAQNSTRFRAGAYAGTSAINAFGGAGGAFGDAGESAAAFNASTVALPAAANTGAAGGSAASLKTDPPNISATSGAGGSGKIIVEWQEFA